MKLLDVFEESTQAIVANSGRSILTSLGVAIGIASIVTMVSLIGGIQNSLMSEMGLNKSGLIYIMPASEYQITPELLDQMKKSVPSYENTGIQRASVKSAGTAKEKKATAVYGVDASYFALQDVNISSGAYFSDVDNDSALPVAIVGPGIVEDLFADGSKIIGSSIDIDGVVFSVIGVLDLNNELDQNYSTIFVPEKTAYQRLGMTDAQYGFGYMKSDADGETTVDSTFAFLKDYYDLSEPRDHFAIMSMETITAALDVFSVGFSVLMVVVSSISLVVGGIGIMNMMLTNVADRMKEIGIRRALGARKSDICIQFLAESVSICTLGGVIGVLAGCVFSYAVAAIVRAVVELPINPLVSPWTILGVASVCVVVGIGFGSYPAWKATNLDPVQSLKD